MRTTSDEVVGWDHWWSQLPDSGGRLVNQMCHVPWYWVRPIQARARGPAVPPERLPPSPWATKANERLAEIGMPEAWIEHSKRSFQFAEALAKADDVTVDRDLLHVACLLHDSGLFAEERTSCFAADGATIAKQTAGPSELADGKAEAVALAIRSHISVEPGNVLGKYVQLGTLLDLTAYGVWKLERGFVEQVYERRPRPGFPKDALEEWDKECVQFPKGRAAYARRPGLFRTAVKIAPLPGGWSFARLIGRA